MIPQLVVVLAYMLYANIPWVQQRWANDCGGAAAASVIQYKTGAVVSSTTLMRKADSEGPLASWQIVDLLDVYNIDANIYTKGELSVRPADIVLVDLGHGNHWVTVYSVSEYNIGIVDPKEGHVLEPEKVFWEAFLGVVIRPE